MEEKDPIIDFLALGCQTLVYCEKVNEDLPIRNEDIIKEGNALCREVIQRAQGNRQGSQIIGNKDSVLMVERFITLAYERLKLG